MRICRALVLILCTGLLACSSNKQPLPVPSWGYKADALVIRYVADPKLNMYTDREHTLLLGIFQLQNPKGFKRIMEGQAGIQKLLQWPDAGDSASTLNLPGCVDTKMMVVNPGQKKKVVLDRAVDTKWIGIVAGYYKLDSQRASRLYQLPVKYSKHGFIFKKLSAHVPNCRINLKLGPYGIVKMEGEAF